MLEFLEQLTNGLARGGIYALIALGYTMVYGVMKLINFAHGELFALGAYLGYCLLVSSNLIGGLGPVLAIGLTIILVMGLVALAGHLLEKVAYRPLRHSDRLAAVVSALGASIFLQNAIMLTWGAQYRAYGANLLPNLLITVGGLKIPLIRIVVLFSALVVMLGLRMFIHRTRLGLAIRAAAIDQKAAKLMGVDVRQVITVVFILGPALGGLAGLMVGLYYGQITFNLGQLYGLKAFTAAIIGGIGNITGAMVGGMLLGLIETLGAAYISVGWKDAFTFLVLIMILIVRPTGILPERVVEKL
ncbi:MAG: branched-chain amino acid ABC transporter permease [Deltaproteobacteria bacterium]|jgi:branched-chain amino acid transport system permease protein|nr:branched-chain amino acid ABC transporter permease [Deltaproteobacteria bacterium]